MERFEEYTGNNLVTTEAYTWAMIQNEESECIMKEEVEIAIRELKTGQAAGSDDTTTKSSSHSLHTLHE